jgi:Protein of unknown function (DUF2868)
LVKSRPPPTASNVRRRPFTARLLIELICRREEAAGHPEESPHADAAAIRAGGDLLDRVSVRARELSSAVTLEAAIHRVVRSGSVLVLCAVALAGVLGTLAGARMLGGTSPANLPLTLFALVGLNLVTFSVWLLVQPFSHRIVGLGAYLRKLLQWLIEHPLLQRIARLIGLSQGASQNAGPVPGAGKSAVEVLGLIAADGRGRWLFGAAVHALWLSFALGSSLSLAALLSFRSYELSWQTTMLSTEQLSAIARAVTIIPAKLGLFKAEALSITDTSSDFAHQTWASWLVATSLIYGAIPRAIALVICCLLFARGSRSMGCDPSRPGFARLRTRLIPDSAKIAVLDSDTAKPDIRSRSEPAILPTLQGIVHGVGVDGAAIGGPPTLPGVQWSWLGQVDDAASLASVLQRMSREKVAVLAVAVRSTMTPDRGVDHTVADLVAAARAPTAIILEDLDRLRARGAEPSRSRIAHWQALASSAGAGGLLSWQGERVVVEEATPI